MRHPLYANKQSGAALWHVRRRIICKKVSPGPVAFGWTGFSTALTGFLGKKKWRREEVEVVMGMKELSILRPIHYGIACSPQGDLAAALP